MLVTSIPRSRDELHEDWSRFRENLLLPCSPKLAALEERNERILLFRAIYRRVKSRENENFAIPIFAARSPMNSKRDSGVRIPELKTNIYDLGKNDI